MLAIFAIGIALFVGVYSTLMAGNFWFTEEGVLREIRLSEPAAKTVLTSKRAVWDDSKITVELEDGSRKVFALDTNMLFNYAVKPE
jgi:hypothetical protein